MTDGDALLPAVMRNPAEDTPRLAYADWLEEQGEPVTAELVRLRPFAYAFRLRGASCGWAVFPSPGGSTLFLPFRAAVPPDVPAGGGPIFPGGGR